MQEVNGMSEEERIEVKSPAVTRKLEGEAQAAKPRPKRAETRKLDPEPETAAPEATPSAVVPAPHLGLTREETSWAAIAHGSVLVTLVLGIASGSLAAILGPIIPALIWYAYRGKSEYVEEQARQATIFQLVGVLGLYALALVGAILVALGWTVSAVLLIVLVGILLMIIMLLVTLLWAAALVALPIVQVVYGCYAALEAYNGRPFRYWWIADLIDRYQAQS
jgi:uncharacterized Tic20 family protein